MPRDFKKCKGVVAAWGVGGEPFAFPSDAGYPVGEEHGGSTYYMFEAHYDNPGVHENGSMAGSNVYKFAEDPLYKNNHIPSVKELYTKICEECEVS